MLHCRRHKVIMVLYFRVNSTMAVSSFSLETSGECKCITVRYVRRYFELCGIKAHTLESHKTKWDKDWFKRYANCYFFFLRGCFCHSFRLLLVQFLFSWVRNAIRALNCPKDKIKPWKRKKWNNSNWWRFLSPVSKKSNNANSPN